MYTDSNEYEALHNQLTSTIANLISNGNTDEAKKHISEWKQFNHKDTDIYSLSSMIHIEERNFEDAEKDLIDGLFESPCDFDLLYNLGYVYELKESLLQANDAYLRALRYAGNDDQKQAAEDMIASVKERMSGIEFSKIDQIKALNKIVNIYYYGRSGSIFFHSLFDGHSKVIMLPTAYLTSFYIFSEAIMQLNEISKEALICIFKKCFPLVLDSTIEIIPKMTTESIGSALGFTAMGENMDEHLSINGPVFFDLLYKYISGEKNLTSKYLLQVIHVAYHEAIGNTFSCIDEIPVIVLQTHEYSEKIARKLINDFYGIKFIYTTRMPAKGFLSLVRYAIKTVKKEYVIDLLGSIMHNMLCQFPVLLECANRTFVIRLEDLHNCSKDTMTLVADCLNIRFEDALLASTFDGIKYWNAADAVKVSGFNNVTTTRSYDDIASSFDIFRLEAMFNNYYALFKYDTFEFGEYNILFALLAKPFKFVELIAESREEAAIFNKQICDHFQSAYAIFLNSQEQYLNVKSKIHLLSPKSS